MEKWKLIGYGSEGEYHFVKNDENAKKITLLSIVSTNILGDCYKSNKYAIFLESHSYVEINDQNNWIKNALLKSGYLESEIKCFIPDVLISITRNYYGYDKNILIDIIETIDEAIQKYIF